MKRRNYDGLFVTINNCTILSHIVGYTIYTREETQFKGLREDRHYEEDREKMTSD